LVDSLFGELNVHFMKEEKVVFPFETTLVADPDAAERFAGLPSLSEPVQVMEADHEAAGDILTEIRAVTQHYQAPEGACNSYRLLYRLLNELDEDLRLHIHLENNI